MPKADDNLNQPLTYSVRKAKVHSTYDAVALIEMSEADEEELLEAWQFLHDNGMAYQLQGWYGRQAQALIKEGLINE